MNKGRKRDGGRVRPHYAWIVCAGCALLLFCTSGLGVNAFTIYQPYILLENGFTNAQSSTIIAFRNLFNFGSALLARAFYHRLRLRTGMVVAGGLAALSFVLFGYASRYWMYCLAAGVMGIAHGLGTMIPISLMLERWFVERRNTALGICTAVTGLSTLGIPSVITHSVEAIGLGATLYIEAAAVGALILLCGCLLRNSPQEMGMLPLGEDVDTVMHTRSAGLTRGDWFLIVPMLLLIGGVVSVSYSHITVLLIGEGYSKSIAAIAISVSGITLMCGKAAYGRSCDSLGQIKSNYVFGALFIIGLLLCCLVGRSPLVLFSAMVAYSFGIAYMSVGLSSWAVELSSTKDFEKTVQIFQIGYATGSLLFSSLPGILADRAGGSYVPAYSLFLLFAIFVLAAIQIIFYRHRAR